MNNNLCLNLNCVVFHDGCGHICVVLFCRLSQNLHVHMGITLSFACLLITIRRFAYRYGSSIRLFFAIFTQNISSKNKYVRKYYILNGIFFNKMLHACLLSYEDSHIIMTFRSDNFKELWPFLTGICHQNTCKHTSSCLLNMNYSDT